MLNIGTNSLERILSKGNVARDNSGLGFLKLKGSPINNLNLKGSRRLSLLEPRTLNHTVLQELILVGLKQKLTDVTNLDKSIIFVVKSAINNLSSINY